MCAWCDREDDLSDEHVFPEWISNELRRYRLVRETERGPIPVRAADLLAPVCAFCNNRWLSVIEKDVQPILSPMIHRPEAVQLSLGDQQLLATWAVKTAMMVDLASPEPIIPLGFYHRLRQQRVPLSSNWVWLGAYGGNQYAIGVRQRVLDTNSVGFVTTFNVLGVVFQVAGHFTRGDARLTDTRRLARALWQIAPALTSAVKWPRDGLALDEAALDELADSFSVKP